MNISVLHTYIIAENEISYDKHAEKGGIDAGNSENWRDAQKNQEIFVKILFHISENTLEIIFAF